ncbi:MAG: hypothetical protein WAO07_01795 [Desulfobacterales bacterium]
MPFSCRLKPSALMAVVFIVAAIVSFEAAEGQTADVTAADEQTAVYHLPPSKRGGHAVKLIYNVDVPIEVFWKFKTDFDGDFLETNRYIDSSRFVYRTNDTVVTETRYTGSPNVAFRWQTTLYPSVHGLSYVLLNPKDCGQKFNYGFIKLEAVAGGTRVTHTSYFDFFGATIWAGLPGPIGMEAFLRYTARWERETILRLLPRYQPDTR